MMKEAEYTMEKVNDEYKLKEVVDGRPICGRFY